VGIDWEIVWGEKGGVRWAELGTTRGMRGLIEWSVYDSHEATALRNSSVP
jgi:hypothetical protein